MVIYPKQEQAYRDAVDRGDWYAANLFYIPPIYRPWELIESDMRMEELVANFEAEQKFVGELPEDLLETYIKMKFNIIEPKVESKKPLSFWDWIFKGR